MKRDMDLARRILLELEECAEADGHEWIEITIEGKSREDIVYHVMLLHEAGLIEADNLSDMDGPDWAAKRLKGEREEREDMHCRLDTRSQEEDRHRASQEEDRHRASQEEDRHRKGLSEIEPPRPPPGPDLSSRSLGLPRGFALAWRGWGMHCDGAG